MYSVTKRIELIKQPRGGYINVKDFDVIQLNDNIKLYDNENIHASIVGLAVDYLTRYSIGSELKKVFSVSLRGADLINDIEKANILLNNINGLDDKSISNACKLSGYDVCFRAGVNGYKPVDEICPDSNTIFNIMTMVKRSISFFKEYGPVTVDGFVFEGAYTDVVSSGDGDFLTKDTLWDFKVIKKSITSKHTLQLLMYYIMGKKSINEEFKTIKNIGVFNPRLNIVYILDTNKIPYDVINEVSKDVIGYK